MVNDAILAKVQQYSKLIPLEMEVMKVYLFGSYAKGKAHEDSDIDVAIVLANMNDFFDTQMKLMRLRRKVDLRIEPHPININEFNQVNPLANEILTHGFEVI